MANLPISTNDVVRKAPGLLQAEIDDEVVALKMGTDACYGLNELGSRIWQLLAEPIRVSKLCELLMMEYDVEAIVCERQVLDLLEELRAEKLISCTAYQ
jgi:hypothetical protein